MRFYLRWLTPRGDEIVVEYCYTGCGGQAGYSEKRWKERCIRRGKRDGFRFAGEVKGKKV